jgi:hypothetical protein
MKLRLILSILLITISTSAFFAQNNPTLLIDNVSNTFTNVSLPYWLLEGQTINLGANAKSVSILEFTVANNEMLFSRAVALTSVQTVPMGKVWKIEAIGLKESNTNLLGSASSSTSSATTELPTIFKSPKKYEVVGTYSWKVPPGVTTICVEVWSGGGGGSSDIAYQARGGGGYGYDCFSVTPGTNYSINVGAGGVRADGGTSSFGDLIYAIGGKKGVTGTVLSNGGTSSAEFTISGGQGDFKGGDGGDGGNGGIAGNGGYYGGVAQNGGIPGGGGGAFRDDRLGSGASSTGARGQVYVYW